MDMSIKSIIENHNTKVAVGTILLSLAWMGIAPSFFHIVKTGTIGIWMEKLYNLINGNVLLNIPILVVLIVVCRILCKKILRYKTANSLIIGIIVFVLFVLYYHSSFKYATLFWCIDYRFVFAFLGGIVVVVWIGRIIYMAFLRIINTPYWGINIPLLRRIVHVPYLKRMIFNTIRKKTKIHPLYIFPPQGFSMDYNNEHINHSDPVLSYAESIVNRLRKTDFSENDGSFAIGVTSEWGAGKTTFLELLEKKLEEEGLTDIVTYNPWMCNSPEQVTRDFFTTLRNDLSDKYPYLSNPIRKYARCLESISFSFPNVFSVNFNGFASNESLAEMKRHLSERFAKLKKPVVVIIDDLDRLNSDEVFEVLRLIRNTASISNIIYLVAYDKDYITKILERKEISSPSAYLEKIFQLEIQLPLVTYTQIWDTFITDLKLQLPREFDINCVSKDRELIEKVLNTYRRAKRFARLLSLSYHFFSREDSMHELDKNEILLVDLLHMDDKRVYDLLCNSPEEILDSSDGIWIYKKSRDNEHNIALNDGSKIKIKDTTNGILTSLWGLSSEREPQPNSIRRKECSEEYFTLNVQFSRRDFETMINNENVDSLICDWHDRRKIPGNFLKKIETYKNDKLTESQKKNLLFGLLSYSYYEFRFDCPLEEASAELKENSHVVIEWFDMKTDCQCDYLKISQMAGFLDYLQVLDQNNTQELILNIVSKQFKNNKADILSIFESQGYLFNFIHNFDAFLSSSNSLVAYSKIIDLYSTEETKPSIDDFCEKYKALTGNKVLHPLYRLFGENWRQYCKLLFLKCVDTRRIAEYNNNDLVKEILSIPSVSILIQ